MSLIKTRISFISQLIAAAERNPRIVGLVDYGSSSEGRADAWSDVDVALFIRDAELASFEVQREGIRQTARLARIVCTAVAEQHGWPWPEALAGRIEALLNVSHESIE